MYYLDSIIYLYVYNDFALYVLHFSKSYTSLLANVVMLSVAKTTINKVYLIFYCLKYLQHSLISTNVLDVCRSLVKLVVTYWRHIATHIGVNIA